MTHTNPSRPTAQFPRGVPGRCGAPWVLALLLATAGGAALAAERDPTLAPPAAFASMAAAGEAGAPAKPVLPSMDGAAVLVQGGKPLLLLGPKSYAEGQKMGPYTLERIGETEVWMRDGKTLHKIHIFSGIERHTATERPTP